MSPSFKIYPIICFPAQGFSLLMTPLYISSTPLKSLHPKRIKSHRILSFNPAGQPHSHHGCYNMSQPSRCIIGFLIRCSMRCVSHRGHKKSAFQKTEMDQLAKSLRSWKQRDPWRMKFHSYQKCKVCIFPVLTLRCCHPLSYHVIPTCQTDCRSASRQEPRKKITPLTSLD